MNPTGKHIFVFILGIIYSSFVIANDEQKIDSLKLVIESEVHDSVKIKAYNDWDNLIYYKDPDLDQELNFKIVTICTENLSKTLHPIEIKFFKTYQSKAFNNLALIFKANGDLDQALDYHLKSLELKKEIGDQDGIALLTMNLGSIAHIKGDLIKALKYYYESLKLFEELENQNGRAGVLVNIGAIYHYQKEYQEAIYYYSESLKIYDELGMTLKAGRNYSNIGLVYYEQGDSLEKAGLFIEANEKYDVSLEFQLKALKIFEEANSQIWIGMAYNNIGTSYYAKKKLDLALEYFQKSYDIKEKQNNKPEMSSALSNMAEIHLKKSNLDKAKEYADKAYELAIETNSIVRVNAAAHVLYKIHKALNNTSLALKYYEEFVSTTDSLENEENNKLTIHQQFKYEYEKKATADSIVQAEALKVKNAEIAAKNAQIAAKNAQAEKDKLLIKRQREQKFYLYGGLALVALFGLFMANRVIFIKRQKKIIEKQKIEVETQKDKIEFQHHQLEETHKEISDSIKYAKRLQTAILPEMGDLNQELKNGFVIFEPKDVVSGDFYWMQPTANGILFAAADCTGHGVPGAMVSVVCSNALNRAVKEFNCTEPASVLDKTKELVIETFEGSSAEIKDGMDIALCKLTYNSNGADLTFAGANNPLWILRNGATEMEEIKGSKQPIGKYELDDPFIQHEISLKKDDCLFIFSDGYADQFGGVKGKKFKYRTLKEMLVTINHLSMDEQKLKLLSIFNEWKGDFEQVDDVTIIGVKI